MILYNWLNWEEHIYRVSVKEESIKHYQSGSREKIERRKNPKSNCIVQYADQT